MSDSDEAIQFRLAGLLRYARNDDRAGLKMNKSERFRTLMATATHLLTEEEATAHPPMEAVVVRFAGDSGDGMQLTGGQFTLSTALAGNDLATFPDFPGGNPRAAGDDLRRLRLPDQFRVVARSIPPATSPTCWWR